MCRRLCLVVATLVLVTACDRTVVEPRAADAALAALLREDASAGVSPYTLRSLVHAAVRGVRERDGATSARALLENVRRIQDLTQAQGVAGEGRARLDAMLEDEQLALVLRVFGDDIVPQVVAAVRADVAHTRRLYQRQGLVHRAPAGLSEIDPLPALDRLLDNAVRHVAAGRADRALADATAAAAILDSLRASLVASFRIPTLEEYFQAATAAPAAAAPAARARMREYAAAAVRAGEAMARGEHIRAHEALARARDEQIRFVFAVRGDAPARLLVRELHIALDDVREILSDATLAGGAAQEQRMLDSAARLADRAAAALGRGEPDVALDLGSHAAGLLNTLRAHIVHH